MLGWVKSFAIFYYVLVYGAYTTWPKQFKPWKVDVVIGSIVVVGTLLCIFIIKGFQTIVFIFIVISTTFRLICPLALFRCLSNLGTYMELWTTSFIEFAGVACLILLAITGYKYSCIVTRLQSGLNLQPPDDCLLRSLGNQRL